MLNTIIFILFIIGLLVLAFFLSRMRMKRSLQQVLKIFREKGALDHHNAMTREELGITPQSIIERMYKVRDYKPYALQLMVEAGIIIFDEEGKFYLSETNFANSNLRKLLE